ncbi:MAG: DUF2059 domain-containing protein [Gemmatimonadaceae bacterium]|nr:DUF2059 domain-containing protein [Gemmatimonadaceae bacterium]
MRHTRMALLALVFAAVAPLAQAQVVDTIAEPHDAVKRALVSELVQVANFRQQVVRTMRETARLQAATMPAPPGFWDRVIARAEQDVDTLIAPLVEDYARYFSNDDLRALIVFYKTPAGQRSVLVAPIMGANSSVAGSRWGQRVGMEVGAELLNDGAQKGKPSTKPVKP